MGKGQLLRVSITKALPIGSGPARTVEIMLKYGVHFLTLGWEEAKRSKTTSLLITKA